MSLASPRFHPSEGTPAAPPRPAALDPTGARGPLWAGALAAAVLVLGLGLWGALAAIDGAVVAPARLAAGPARVVVQHPEGGRLIRLAVAEGERVAAGAPLAWLDPGGLGAERDLIAAQMAEGTARAARLAAERDGTPLPPGAALDAQRRLLAARRDTLHQQIAQLRRRQTQAAAQRDGLLAQASALAAEGAILHDELSAAEALRAAGHTQAARVTALRRDALRLAGAEAGARAEGAALDGRITEIDLQILALRAARREEAEAALADLAPLLLEQQARLAVIDGRLDRLVLRAPVAGRLHGLATAGPGAVLRPAEPLAEIVPEAPPGRLTAPIRPQDIGRLHPGQAGRLRLTASGGADPPEIAARLVRLSADAFTDPQTGQGYFLAEIAFDPADPALRGRAPLAGEPAEVLITTGTRSPLAWLLAPLTAYFGTALRED